MRRLVTGLAVGVMTLVAVGLRSAAPQAPAADPPPSGSGLQFVIKPYLQFPTLDSLVVMAETSEPTSATVAFGETPDLPRKVESTEPATIHEWKLTGLKPETKYFYQVTATDSRGQRLASPLLTGMTAVPAESAWSFGVIGDTQKNPATTAKVAKQIWDRRPHFVIHCGDVVDNGPDKAEWVHELFGPAAELFGRVALFPCIGNHEKNHANYYRYFSLPQPEYYYRYRYGNADFFSIDSNKPLSPGSEQYEWLDRELGRSKATWKIAYHHHPVYSSDEDDYGNTWKGSSVMGDLNARHLMALYDKHNLDINFNGHIHLYERSWPARGGRVDWQRGVRYITSGGGGARLENFAPTPTWFKAECRVDFHYCYVTVHGGRLSFKAFDHNGMLFDAFELSKGGP